MTDVHRQNEMLHCKFRMERVIPNFIFPSLLLYVYDRAFLTSWTIGACWNIIDSSARLVV